MRRSYIIYIYALLFATYVVLEASASMEVTQAPWLKSLSHWSPVPIALLLLILILRAEEGRKHLIAALGDASAARELLKTDLDQLTQLKKETAEIRDGVEDIRQELRSSDAALRGKLFFFQQEYAKAANVFEEVVR